ncbi:glycosyltransferase family 4 protein, partial [Desulfonauticus submarinus]
LKPGVSFFGQINFGIIKELYKNKYDAIIIHGWNHFTNILAVFAAKIFRVKVLLKGEADLNKKRSKFILFVKKLFYIPLFKLADAFLYTYSENKRYFQRYGVKEKKLFWLPCAVDNDFFIKETQKYKFQKEEIKESLGIDRESVVILFSGKFIPRKRPVDLLRAYKLVDFENKALIFVGEGKLRKEMEEFIKQNNLKNVIIAGFINQSEISEYYSVADIFVLPSEYDPSPKALNEIMNFGMVPIVSDKIGTRFDLVEKNKNGFVFKLGDIKELADVLDKLLKDRVLRRNLSQKTIEVVKKWSFENEVSGVLEALNYLNKNGKI